MRSAVLGFATGIILLQQQAALLKWPFLLLLALLAMILGVASVKLGNAAGRGVCRYAGGALIGWCWASLIAAHGLTQRLPADLEEQDIVVVGVIRNLPVEADFGQRFQFQIERVISPGVDPDRLPKKILLSWYDLSVDLQPGQRWQLQVRLRRPHGLANPHGFDYEVWLLEQGIGATGSVRLDKAQRGSANNQRLDEFVVSANSVIERLRDALRNRILAALPDQPYAPIIVALVIGDQNAIPQTDWKVVSRTGISHLIAISGLHISMVSGMAATLMLALWRRSFFTRASLPLLLPAQKAAALAGIAMALIYVALAGFGVPAQRALIMISAAAGSLWLNRKIGVSHVLSCALGLVLLFDPWAGLWPGFWLSFAAVGFIFYASRGRHDLSLASSRWQRWKQGIQQTGAIQYAITLGLLPLTLLLFNQISLVSPIANAIAIPLVSLLVMPLSLLACIVPDPLGASMLQIAHQALVYLFDFLRWLSALEWATWRAPRPEFWMFVCALLGMFWLLAPKGWPMRWAGMIAWLPLLFNAATFPAPGTLTVTALDIGQGMALLVETAHHRLLYDTGPAYSANSDAGSRVIYPYLATRGIDRLDGMIVSHNDSDHSGGAASLLQLMKIDWVSSSLDLQSNLVQLANQHSQHTRCLAGQQWDWDGVRFEILHPVPAIYQSAKWKPNAKSCTLKITNGKHSMLLPGDIEAVQEDELVHAISARLPSTVLLAPHHGSSTSSTRQFLQTVDPQIALFQLGYHNRYHHPKPEVWQRYAELGIQRLRSDESGALTLQFSDQVEVEAYRQSRRRYWYPTLEPG